MDRALMAQISEERQPRIWGGESAWHAVASSDPKEGTPG